jgi:PKD repeat protein
MTRALRTYALTGAAVAALVAAACTMKEQEAPPLTGPSEFATSITVQITPDTITQDGASQSIITVTASGPNREPIRNLPVRLDTIVNGELVDFGSLSARTIYTGGDGKATATYTAPVATPNGGEQMVTIRVTPAGSDAAGTTPRTASLRLVPQGTVSPPSTITPTFTRTPESATEGQPILFTSTNDPAQILAYAWSFGDGGTASGRTVTNTYDKPGSYLVTLTITDNQNRSRSASQTVTIIGAGVRPRAVFVYSPLSPVNVGTSVRFDASDSEPTLNATITSYEWTFGDAPTLFTSNDSVIRHTYTAAGQYTITLTIRDSLGGFATTTRTIAVQ